MFQLNKKTILMIFISCLITVIALSYYLISTKSTPEIDNTKKWYLHGLVYNDVFNQFQEELLPYNIKLVSSGCIIGGEEYQRDIRNNQQIYDSAPSELKLLLGNPKSRIWVEIKVVGSADPTST